MFIHLPKKITSQVINYNRIDIEKLNNFTTKRTQPGVKTGELI